MKKETLLGVFLFSGLWGLSEAVLGGWLYRTERGQVACVVLAVVAMAVLTVARVSIPRAGSSTAIAALAMLYKFLNSPFFACHLLAIFLLGAAFDVVFSLARGRYKPLIGAAATVAGFAAFALIITYLVRYSHWTAGGWPKVARYVFLNGTIAAACNAVVVPLAHALARRPASAARLAAALGGKLVPAAAAVAALLWGAAAVRGVIAIS